MDIGSAVTHSRCSGASRCRCCIVREAEALFSLSGRFYADDGVIRVRSPTNARALLWRFREVVKLGMEDTGRLAEESFRLVVLVGTAETTGARHVSTAGLVQ